ncbi:hypothetical protein [Saccharibacillus brassicae]|uniref:Uncharacterized protein n=1 Tax=Saccharibacillus brassicae TaxID=2583377 RepID=A0A4Y6V438_SACBS|nr:hypothetical protein [Saccharibacillus brassicae]QDH23440.1 hypothetical protein FFV09_22785 [Saccharibacillus brassicae]
MARKFQYYNVAITLNAQATTIYFTEFLDKIRKLDWEKRIRKINNYPTALFEINIPSEQTDCRIVGLGKYRQQVKPYIGDINTSKADMIENDIIEMISLVTIPTARTVLVEYSFYGSKAKDLEEYFNSFFINEDPAQQWAIKFVPVDSKKSLKDVRKSSDIKNIQLKMNVEAENFSSILESSKTKAHKDSLFANIMSAMDKIKEDVEAPIVELKFGKGRQRKLQLDGSEILKLLELLQIDQNESVLSCSVLYKNDATSKYESIELKNVGIMSDIVLENVEGNHAWGFVGDKILERYNEKGRPGSVTLQKWKYVHDKKLPLLTEIPKEEYRVAVQKGERKDLGNASA